MARTDKTGEGVYEDHVKNNGKKNRWKGEEEMEIDGRKEGRSDRKNER